jgi:hypothetical protein
MFRLIPAPVCFTRPRGMVGGMKMFQTTETTEIVEQQIALDDYLEKAAEVIAAQAEPASALDAAKARLVRKVRELARLAHDHMARRR